jgi:hypothetical protein
VTRTGAIPLVLGGGPQNLRSYEMTEIGVRGLEACLTEAFEIGTDECAACSSRQPLLFDREPPQG